MTREIVASQVILDHEIKLRTNISIKDISVAKHCSIETGDFYKIELRKVDLDRIYICFGLNFVGVTREDTFKLEDVKDEAGLLSSASFWIGEEIDLSKSITNAPIFLADNLDLNAFVALDGNHRLIAHFLTHRTIHELQAYVFVHADARKCEWFHPTQRLGEQLRRIN